MTLTVRNILSLLLFSGLTSGQTFEVNDRNGVPLITVSDVMMFRYSDYFKKDIPDFRGTIKNVSGRILLRVSITGIVHMKDGSAVRFTVGGACDKGAPPCDLGEDFVHEAQTMFGQPSKFYQEDFESVEFTLEAKQLKTEAGFHFAGFVAKDEGCFNDYLATKSLKGIALRKKLAELLGYGCGFVVEMPLQAHILDEKKTFTIGQKKFTGVHIFLTDIGIQLGLDSPSHHNDFGWVLIDALEPGTVLTLEDIGTTRDK
jgi:hypothetical protein